MGYQEIIYEKANRVATITFNRPERLNALTQHMRVEILDAIKDASADDDMRVVVFRGAGKGFCAGADLTPTKNPATKTEHPEPNSGLPRDGFQEVFARVMWDMPQPDSALAWR